MFHFTFLVVLLSSRSFISPTSLLHYLGGRGKRMLCIVLIYVDKYSRMLFHVTISPRPSPIYQTNFPLVSGQRRHAGGRKNLSSLQPSSTKKNKKPFQHLGEECPDQSLMAGRRRTHTAPQYCKREGLGSSRRQDI